MNSRMSGGVPDPGWNVRYAHVVQRIMEPEHGVWHVLIEETISGQEHLQWALTRTQPFDDRAAALAAADATARWYVPQNPGRPQDRMVFRTSDDVWTVWVEGATRGFHLRVSVAQYIAPFQA